MAQFAHAASEPSPQERAQGYAVGVADHGGDALDVVIGGLEQMHSALHSPVLEVGQRRLAECILEAARQRAFAGGG